MAECDWSGLDTRFCGCPKCRPRISTPAGPVLKISARGEFWQLWARSITGVNLEEHCMASLRGDNVPGLGPRTPRNRVLEFQMPEIVNPVTGVVAPTLAWYVCGVSTGNELSNNAHMLAVADPGNRAILDWPWVKAVIYDARRIQIVPGAIDPHHRQARNPKFFTCRNWQAAWMIKKGQLQ